MSTRLLGFALGHLEKVKINRRGSDMGGLVEAMKDVADHVAAKETVTVLARADKVFVRGGYEVLAGQSAVVGAQTVFAAPVADSGDSFGMEFVFAPKAISNHIEICGGGAGDMIIRLVRVSDTDWDVTVGDTVATGTTQNAALNMFVADDILRFTVHVDDRELGTGNFTVTVENLTQNLVSTYTADNLDEFVGAISFANFGLTNSVANVAAVEFYSAKFLINDRVELEYDFSYEGTWANSVFTHVPDSGAFQAVVGEAATPADSIASVSGGTITANQAVATFRI